MQNGIFKTKNFAKVELKRYRQAHSSEKEILRRSAFLSSSSTMTAKLKVGMAEPDPNMLSWAQYLQDDSESSDSENDFRGDSLNDADWDGQGRGLPLPDFLKVDFTKQYNRQRQVVQNAETGVPPAQGPKRNPQSEAPSSIAHAAFTSRKGADFEDPIQNLTRYAGRINLKQDTSK
jgi:hypothetical protein